MRWGARERKWGVAGSKSTKANKKKAITAKTDRPKASRRAKASKAKKAVGPKKTR